jgi:hypothetical protein
MVATTAVDVELEQELWACFGLAVAGDHGLVPHMSAERDKVGHCTCGKTDPLCPVRSLLRSFGLA